MSHKNTKITFIGAGNMAHSLIGGLIADNFPAKNLWATAPNMAELQDLHQRFGIHVAHDNCEGAKHTDVIVLAVKPLILKTVVTELKDIIQQKKPLVISIAAGVRETNIQRWIGGDVAIVRVMPNTPALVKTSASGLYANSFVDEEQKNLAESILRAVGITVWANEESQLDAITALSGSGPAYFFRIMEALENAATQMGLSAETAHLLTLQTALGAARMALETSDSISTLRQKVTSPGGVTERALQALENADIEKIIADTLKGAQQRSVELAELFGKEA